MQETDYFEVQETQPNQILRKQHRIISRLKVAFWPLFPTANNFSWVGIDFIQGTEYTTPNPTKFSANTLRITPPPPALLGSLKYAYSPCVLSSFQKVLSCVLDVDLFSFFLLFLPFFGFDYVDIVCFILSFSCGFYAVSSVSVSAANRLAYDTYLDTYVR